MTTRSLANAFLEQEARALLTRLDRVRPLALHETMVPAAALGPAAQLGIERFLLDGRQELRRRVLSYLAWLRGAQGVPPAELQRRFALLRWRFNDVLSQFDLFQQVVTQRSEHEVGVWLSGLDVAAADALTLPGHRFDPPPIVCYLDRGPGAAIRRARTRLPGGGDSPVAIIRMPRERMVGHGIASSLVHEVGHQLAALLALVPSIAASLPVGEGPRERLVWALYRRWLGEIVPDVFAVGKLGIAATLGLIGVVGLPRWFVFRVTADDPHPFPWIRVRLSAAAGQALYPHPQWRDLAGLWAAMYPADALDDERRRLLLDLSAAAPRLVELIIEHRPAALGGASLREVLPLADRTPDRLATHLDAWRCDPAGLHRAPPTLAFAVLGQARAGGRLSPESESPILGELLTRWALTSTFAAARLSVAGADPPAGLPGRIN
jgi:hypothetical protein